MSISVPNEIACPDCGFVVEIPQEHVREGLNQMLSSHDPDRDYIWCRPGCAGCLAILRSKKIPKGSGKGGLAGT